MAYIHKPCKLQKSHILKFPLSPQFFVKMVMSDLVVDETLLKDELRSVSTTDGAQFVMIHGMAQMPQLFVSSLDFLQKVGYNAEQLFKLSLGVFSE